jgi:sugar phosphate isomerase/epimerase
MFMSEHTNNFPKLHNAMWPGLVGKGSPGAEPCIDLDTMLDLTARAEVEGVRFDGVDLFLFDPHVSIDSDKEGIQRLAEKIQSRGFTVGSVVAPVWPPTGGGSAMGSDEDRKRFVGQVRKACQIGSTLRELGVRPYGVIRIDSASGVSDWTTDPEANQAKIAATFREACDVAADFGERLAAEGEICWGGMQSWRKMVDLLERVNRPERLGFQADMAHTLLYVLGYNAPEDAILPPEWDWSGPAKLEEALRTLTSALRPWTIDFHVAQNDATVHGSGTHDKTGHHCLPKDPNGKLDIPRHAGFWLRDESGKPTKVFKHICWDGCMFANQVMMKQQTWNDILSAMIAVRDAHGWRDDDLEATAPARASKTAAPVELKSPSRSAKRKVPSKKAKPAKRAAAAAPKRVSAKAAVKHKSRRAPVARTAKGARTAKAPARKTKPTKRSASSRSSRKGPRR